jgi:HEPN domain-containing protein
VSSHSVDALLKLAMPLDPEFKLFKGAKRLDDYYAPTRDLTALPGDIPAHYYDDVNEAEESLSWAERIVKVVSGKINQAPKQGQP